ncbi:MAG: hypothetical protein HOV97_05790 [Nonomuraea sp.]|nr:hypothetical protein [Nonomuraea sp.]
MGTRHLIAVVIDGDFKIAQYGQWDGYPTGQGASIANFLAEPGNVDRLRKTAPKLRWATAEDFERVSAELDLPADGWMNMEQAERYSKAYPALTRDTGADILRLVADETVSFVKDSRSFAQDSLFCEWGYVIDLDNDVVEVYRGFQQDPHNEGRWGGMEPDNGYYPIKLVRTFPIAEFTEAAMSDLETEIYGADEDD